MRNRSEEIKYGMLDVQLLSSFMKDFVAQVKTGPVSGLNDQWCEVQRIVEPSAMLAQLLLLRNFDSALRECGISKIALRLFSENVMGGESNATPVVGLGKLPKNHPKGGNIFETTYNDMIMKLFHQMFPRRFLANADLDEKTAESLMEFKEFMQTSKIALPEEQQKAP